MNASEFAQPVKYLHGHEFVCLGGLTKRELIAVMAMQGLLSNPNLSIRFETCAAMVVRAADALIERLNADPLAEGAGEE